MTKSQIHSIQTVCYNCKSSDLIQIVEFCTWVVSCFWLLQSDSSAARGWVYPAWGTECLWNSSSKTDSHEDRGRRLCGGQASINPALNFLPHRVEVQWEQWEVQHVYICRQEGQGNYFRGKNSQMYYGNPYFYHSVKRWLLSCVFTWLQKYLKALCLISCYRLWQEWQMLTRPMLLNKS